LGFEYYRRGSMLRKGDRCPRCGLTISWVERVRRGDRVYYVAAHSSGGGKRPRRCYLGPEKYVYVSKLHENLGIVLLGASEHERAFEYIRSLLRNKEVRERVVSEICKCEDNVDVDVYSDVSKVIIRTKNGATNWMHGSLARWLCEANVIRRGICEKIYEKLPKVSD
jgi:hypothetical protein